MFLLFRQLTAQIHVLALLHVYQSSVAPDRSPSPRVVGGGITRTELEKLDGHSIMA